MDQATATMKDRAALIAELLEMQRVIAERFKDLTEKDLAKPAEWAGKQMTVRFLLQRFAGHDRNHLNQIRKNRQVVGQPTEAHMLLAQTLVARAELLGEVIGLTDEQFDRAPAEGEWSTRRVLQHCLEVDKRYLENVEKGLAGQ